MQRYKIKIEYEGTTFVGWQFQKNGQSVQEVLQKAIFNFSKEKVIVIGAGSTDSGVHALAQVAHFDLNTLLKLSKLHLPSPKYLIQPTIDLTCCCKNDLEVNCKVILSLFFFIKIFSIVLIGDLAPQDAALKVEKSWVPNSSLAPFFINFKFSFFRMCHALFFCSVKGDCLLTIIYL